MARAERIINSPGETISSGVRLPFPADEGSEIAAASFPGKLAWACPIPPSSNPALPCPRHGFFLPLLAYCYLPFFLFFPHS